MRLSSVFILPVIGLLTFLESNQHSHIPPVFTTLHNSTFISGLDTGFLINSNYQFPTTGTLSSDTLTTVSTFQNISLYWKPIDGASTREALVRYRIKGNSNWAQAQSLWFDDRQADSIGNNILRSKEYRGSIVNLSSGTVYEIEVFLSGVNQIARKYVTTMS